MAKVMKTGHSADDQAPAALYHFVDGERVPGESNRFGDIYNPATAQVIAHAPYASAHEVRKVVASAKAAFPAWAATPAFGASQASTIEPK